MYLTRHKTTHGRCWAVDGQLLPPGLTLAALLSMPAAAMQTTLQAIPAGAPPPPAYAPPPIRRCPRWNRSRKCGARA